MLKIVKNCRAGGRVMGACRSWSRQQTHIFSLFYYKFNKTNVLAQNSSVYCYYCTCQQFQNYPKCCSHQLKESLRVNLPNYFLSLNFFSAIYLHSFPLEMDIQLEVDINSHCSTQLEGYDIDGSHNTWSATAAMIHPPIQKLKIPRTWSQTGIGRLVGAFGNIFLTSKHFTPLIERMLIIVNNYVSYQSERALL